MTDPTYELIICLINYLSGIFIMISYTGVLIIEKKLNKYLISIVDFISCLLIGFVYLFILINNQIYFHFYFIFFIIIGYLTGYYFLYDQLLISYNKIFIILKYLNKKFKIVFRWSFDIIPFKIFIKAMKKLRVRVKIKLKHYKLKRKLKLEEKAKNKQIKKINKEKEKLKKMTDK